MPIRSSQFFNNPQFAQAASNLASLFEPPSGADAAGWAEANAKKQVASQLAQQFDYITNPANQAAPDYQRRADSYMLATGGINPTQSFFAQNQNDATKRRGDDITAATSRANNADDNARALEVGQLGGLADFYKPVGEGEIRPAIPQDVAGRFGVTRELPADQGRVKPLTDDQLKAAILGQMPQSAQEAAAFGNTPVENVVTPNGPRIATRLDAIGQEPVIAKGQTINVGGNNDIGTIPAGMQVIRDGQGNVTGMKPIPGGPAAKADADSAAQVAAKSQTRNASADIVVDDIDRALANIDASPMLNTGVGAAVTGAVPGTPAFNTSALIDTVKANAGFDKLQAMREASPTGGALGAVSDAENHMLQAAIGNLNTSQNTEQLQYNLKRVSNIYRDIIDGPGNGQRYDLKTGALVGGPAPAQRSGLPGTADGTIIQNSAGDKMVRRGGKWEPM
ncbi:hypothetical protein [Mesorhizobium sp. B2-3-12]|uniref:hypothetical protein n=1 Tax=Mesorhizobium sp. B2-3-12 TaxID=2589952 RepID=UPI00112C736F|nr:hypothetical protein [Mesorhizobium sp. B2-3-12]TPL87125.1 hypothetical protein FJ948_21755 [Mesorhizobium sp. B2-3-12]